jgi:putative ABC transport system substrate-binding protein
MDASRRWFLTRLPLATVILPFPVQGQPIGKRHRIGVLSPGAPPPGLLEAFVEALHELGYVDGKTLTIEWRFAAGKNERLAALAGELVRLKVDVIFAVNTPAAQAAKKATTSIPIVIARLADPVKTGLVASLARPGGNITGLSSITDEVGAKRLELLKEALPGTVRVAVLWNAANPGHVFVIRGMEHAASKLGLQLQSVPVRGPDDFNSAFQGTTRSRAEAVVVVDDVLISSHKAAILDLAMKQAVPVVANHQELAEAGALMSYAQSVPDEYRRAAHYVDRILRGAKPADLPIEQPTKFLLVLNLKTAKALGLTIPPSLLLRADKVIE